MKYLTDLSQINSLKQILIYLTICFLKGFFFTYGLIQFTIDYIINPLLS